MAVPRNPINRIEDSRETPGTYADRHNTLELNGLNPIQATVAPNIMTTARRAENTANVDEVDIAERVEDRSEKVTIWSHNAFGSVNNGLQVGVTSDTSHINFNYAESQSIFGSLVPENHHFETSTLDLLARRAQVQAGRIAPRQLQDRCYAPYRTVKKREIKSRLLQIAKVTQFLDRGFAEYFQVAVLSFGKEHAEKLLDDARKTIAKMQNQQEDPSSADVGDLGHFCEQSTSTCCDPNRRNPRFTITQRRDHEILRYLQDALEVPYWEFMVDIFLGWKANSSALSGDVVLRVLQSAKLDLLDGRRRLLDEIALLQDDNADDIAPIIDGIDARIAVLESVWDNASSNLDGTHYSLVSYLEQSQHPPCIVPEEPPIPPQDEQLGRQIETATLIALILLFIIAAIIPGYKAFALSMHNSAVGSTGDADFWYQIQNSIMAVMGNVIMVVPLVKKSWFSPAYGLMWGFFTLGVVFAVISVLLYPLLNPGWSSMVSFFGSIASVASVLIMTQATAREGSGSKVKLKSD